MLRDILEGYEIILASGSPRRQSFFKELDIDFEIQLKPIEEVYPKNLKGAEISDYLSQLKAAVFLAGLKVNQIVITSDTIVWHKSNALGKPENKDEAIKMLMTLSGESHEVITSVCLSTKGKQIIINDTTKVTFKVLSPQ
ncbi:MAG: Maf family protein, partial [Bacteroidota bacterium]